jgi:hypothetical protein
LEEEEAAPINLCRMNCSYTLKTDKSNFFLEFEHDFFEKKTHELARIENRRISLRFPFSLPRSLHPTTAAGLPHLPRPACPPASA